MAIGLRCVQFDFLLAGEQAFGADNHLLFVLLVAIRQIRWSISTHVHLVASSNGLVVTRIADATRLSPPHLVQRVKSLIDILFLKVL